MKYIEVQERSEPWPAGSPYPPGVWLCMGQVYVVDPSGQWFTSLMPQQVSNYLKTGAGGGSGIDIHRLFDQLIELRK